MRILHDVPGRIEQARDSRKDPNGVVIRTTFKFDTWHFLDTAFAYGQSLKLMRDSTRIGDCYQTSHLYENARVYLPVGISLDDACTSDGLTIAAARYYRVDMRNSAETLHSILDKSRTLDAGIENPSRHSQLPWKPARFDQFDHYTLLFLLQLGQLLLNLRQPTQSSSNFAKVAIKPLKYLRLVLAPPPITPSRCMCMRFALLFLPQARPQLHTPLRSTLTQPFRRFSLQAYSCPPSVAGKGNKSHTPPSFHFSETRIPSMSLSFFKPPFDLASLPSGPPPY